MFTKPFHKFLNELRVKRGLKQKELAELLGITQQRLSHLESGGRRPSELERAAIYQHFGELQGYLVPEGVRRRLSENARRLQPAFPPFHPAQDRPSDIRFYAALQAYPEFVKRMTAKIRLRVDFQDCQYHCGLIALESSAEVLLVLRLLEAGALPGYCAPASLGPLSHPIIEPELRVPVAHRKFPCLAFEEDFYFFQVTLATPKQHRVDVLRWNRGWSALEIDGSGHDGRNDEERTKALGLEVRRLTPAEITSDHFQLRKAA